MSDNDIVIKFGIENMPGQKYKSTLPGLERVVKNTFTNNSPFSFKKDLQEGTISVIIPEDYIRALEEQANRQNPGIKNVYSEVNAEEKSTQAQEIDKLKSSLILAQGTIDTLRLDIDDYHKLFSEESINPMEFNLSSLDELRSILNQYKELSQDKKSLPSVDEINLISGVQEDSYTEEDVKKGYFSESFKKNPLGFISSIAPQVVEGIDSKMINAEGLFLTPAITKVIGRLQCDIKEQKSLINKLKETNSVEYITSEYRGNERLSKLIDFCYFTNEPINIVNQDQRTYLEELELELSKRLDSNVLAYTLLEKSDEEKSETFRSIKLLRDLTSSTTVKSSDVKFLSSKELREMSVEVEKKEKEMDEYVGESLNILEKFQLLQNSISNGVDSAAVQKDLDAFSVDIYSEKSNTTKVLVEFPLEESNRSMQFINQVLSYFTNKEKIITGHVSYAISSISNIENVVKKIIEGYEKTPIHKMGISLNIRLNNSDYNFNHSTVEEEVERTLSYKKRASKDTTQTAILKLFENSNTDKIDKKYIGSQLEKDYSRNGISITLKNMVEDGVLIPIIPKGKVYPKAYLLPTDDSEVKRDLDGKSTVESIDYLIGRKLDGAYTLRKRINKILVDDMGHNKSTVQSTLSKIKGKYVIHTDGASRPIGYSKGE